MRENAIGRSGAPGWLLAAAIGAALVLGGAWIADMERHGTRDWLPQYGVWVLARADSDARLLGITSAQQAAWSDFKAARRALEHQPAEELPPEGYAGGLREALIVRAMPTPAQQAYVEAAGRLRAVLTPEQTRLFDEFVLPDRHRPGRTWRQLALSLMYILTPS